MSKGYIETRAFGKAAVINIIIIPNNNDDSANLR